MGAYVIYLGTKPTDNHISSYKAWYIPVDAKSNLLEHFVILTTPSSINFLSPTQLTPMAAQDHHQLHFILVPFMAQGHMIPTIDIAKLLAQRGVIVSIVTTQLNALRHKAAVDRAIESNLPIRLLLLRFPCQEAGLPEGCESVDTLPSKDLIQNFFAATNMLQSPLEDSLAELQPKPTCLISDVFFAWTSGVATKFQIPRVIFHGTSCFSLLCVHNLRHSTIHESIDSDSEPFLVPNLPHQIEITKSKLPGVLKKSHDFNGLRDQIREAEESAYGVLINSFDELEHRYSELYREVRQGKSWCVGPLSLCNKDELEKAERGNKASIDKNQCSKWLDSREPNSVIYVCLGSLCRMLAPQLIEIGLALEASEYPFVWVFKGGDGNKELEDWLAREGFEERIKDRGLLIRGWAPQVLILSHRAIGGFLTHCGWNSTLEGLCAGVPMITWPMFAEQFLNEKLIVEVLRVGHKVGVDAFTEWGEEEKNAVVVKKEEIEKAVRRVMDKSGGEEVRRRAEELGEMGRKATEEGGSSHLNMTLFIQDIASKVK